jgi:regulator of protease activity HflC (stomatin/prohibitin superfamily)
MEKRLPVGFIIVFIIIVFTLTLGSRFFKSVPAGHVGVATLFGKVREKPYPAGLHIPVNPLYNWEIFDARNKTHKEVANVPSQDQLQTKIEVSVQYRIIDSQAPSILRETGTTLQVVDVHLVPKLRSLLREQGKSIKRAEDFFLETTQEQLQSNLSHTLSEYLLPKGVEVQAVLIRDIQLPPFITRAIEQKKEREQEAEKQKAELERYTTEQQQKVALAEAELKAAEAEAQKRRVIAEAQAYEIEQINKAIGTSPVYVQLKALEALKDISGDPSAKIYFLNGDSPSPLPLMHMGEKE